MSFFRKSFLAASALTMGLSTQLQANAQDQKTFFDDRAASYSSYLVIPNPHEACAYNQHYNDGRFQGSQETIDRLGELKNLVKESPMFQHMMDTLNTVDNDTNATKPLLVCFSESDKFDAVYDQSMNTIYLSNHNKNELVSIFYLMAEYRNAVQTQQFPQNIDVENLSIEANIELNYALEANAFAWGLCIVGETFGGAYTSACYDSKAMMSYHQEWFDTKKVCRTQRFTAGAYLMTLDDPTVLRSPNIKTTLTAEDFGALFENPAYGYDYMKDNGGYKTPTRAIEKDCRPQ